MTPEQEKRLAELKAENAELKQGAHTDNQDMARLIEENKKLRRHLEAAEKLGVVVDPTGRVMYRLDDLAWKNFCRLQKGEPALFDYDEKTKTFAPAQKDAVVAAVGTCKSCGSTPCKCDVKGDWSEDPKKSNPALEELQGRINQDIKQQGTKPRTLIPGIHDKLPRTLIPGIHDGPTRRPVQAEQARQVKVGDIVWFCPPQECKGEKTLEKYAAIVTQVLDYRASSKHHLHNIDGSFPLVELCTFGPNSVYFQHSVPFSETLKASCWSWREEK